MAVEMVAGKFPFQLNVVHDCWQRLIFPLLRAAVLKNARVAHWKFLK